jgi:aerobic-type carbon monoxide dehydrogenase small subunit (CoxS/CutS family)
MNRITEIRVNGVKCAIDANPDRTLLSVLRDDLDLTGTKYGCGEGQCGACTVLIDGNPARSCRTRIGATPGKDVITIEGLEREGRLHPVQEAFLETGAMQCAFCTSGMIMAAVGLLRRNPKPGRQEIIRTMDGNICRCGTYLRIIAAIEIAAGREALR